MYVWSDPIALHVRTWCKILQSLCHFALFRNCSIFFFFWGVITVNKLEWNIEMTLWGYCLFTFQHDVVFFCYGNYVSFYDCCTKNCNYVFVCLFFFSSQIGDLCHSFHCSFYIVFLVLQILLSISFSNDKRKSSTHVCCVTWRFVAEYCIEIFLLFMFFFCVCVVIEQRVAVVVVYFLVLLSVVLNGCLCCVSG